MDKGGYGGVLSLDTANSDSFAFFANKQQPLILKRKSMDNLGLSMRIEDNGGRDVGPKKRVDEVDFFFDEKKKKMKMECSSDYTDLDLKVAIKKEDYLSINTNLHLLTANTSSNQSMVDDGLSPTEEDIERQNELAVMQSELVRMKEENQKLKGVLSQVTTNYNALQMHLLALKQQRAQRNSNDLANNDNEKQDVKKHERQFMDLGPASVVVDGDEPSHSSTGGGGSLNRSSSTAANNGVNNKEMSTPFDHERSNSREGSPDQGSQDWAPNKQAKLVTSSSSKGPEQAQEATMRKARVSVRARSEAPMISDGCQWRKYGQKMAKGNPCPRAYYRCTMATGCPVRKQVQRCVDDRTILITTYEGNHNHPLPPAAMAMASTTSAAASMLLSGSMSSSDGLVNPTNFLSRTIVPCSSTVATISASAPFPTITLDLTQTNPQNPLQFPILRPPAQLQLNSLPQVFGQVPYSNQSKFSGLQMSQEVVESGQFGQPKSLPGQATNSNLADTVSAATAAITADPNFTVALTAAIKSIIAGGNSTNGNSSSSSTRGNGKESNKTAGSSCFPS